MRFALYHPWIYLTSGIERSILELLGRSRHDWTVWTHHFAPDATYPEMADYDIRQLEPGVSVERRLPRIAEAARRIAGTRLPDAGARGLLVSSEGLGDLILRGWDGPVAAYCHTPLKILHDPVNRQVLEARNPSLRTALKVLGPGFSAVDRWMWRRFDHVFANSQETRRRIHQARLMRPERVELLHPGVDVTRYRDTGQVREPFFLVAGRIMWQKNVELAVEAMRTAHARGSRSRLVVAGAVDEKSRDYAAELARRAGDLPISFEHDPSDERLMHLYRTCQAVVFTPRNEDFGIVPLEAMASGAPVLAVDAGGARETIVDGESGWLLPDDPEAFAGKLVELDADPDKLTGMRHEARHRALAYSWDRFVDRIDDVMEQLATARD